MEEKVFCEKKIVNGKMYNTETATFIGDEWYDCFNDFNRHYEELYIKKTGEFFLVGNGGPCSKYAEWGDRNAFIPLSEGEAMNWIERNCSAETYIKYFGEPEE